MADEGYTLAKDRSWFEPGHHGYDNEYIFFKSNKCFENNFFHPIGHQT